MATPKNRNYLSGINFKFNIDRCPHVEFFTQSVTTPDMRLGLISQPTPFNMVKHPGDELNYGELQIKFMVDEDLKNYNEIYQWVRYISNPDSNEFCGSDYLERYGEGYHSNASLYTLNSHFNQNILLTFRDIFPKYLSGLMFDSTYNDEQNLSAEVNFIINMMDLYDRDGNPMWLS